MSELEQHDIPAPAAAAVEAHIDAAGEGAHTPLHHHADDARVQQVAERFEAPPVGSESQAPGQA